MTITVIAFDYGLTSIGIAYGQSLTGTAQPLLPIKARDGVPNWDNIATIITEWEPTQLVVGLPLNMDDSESELSGRARKFSKRLKGRFNMPTALMDERLTSFAVKQAAKARGHCGNYKKEPIDSLAAQMILEDWFRHTN